MNGGVDADLKTEDLTLLEAIAWLCLIDDEMMRVALQDQIGLVQYILRIIIEMRRKTPGFRHGDIRRNRRDFLNMV